MGGRVFWRPRAPQRRRRARSSPLGVRLLTRYRIYLWTDTEAPIITSSIKYLDPSIHSVNTVANLACLPNVARQARGKCQGSKAQARHGADTAHTGHTAAAQHHISEMDPSSEGQNISISTPTYLSAQAQQPIQRSMYLRGQTPQISQRRAWKRLLEGQPLGWRCERLHSYTESESSAWAWGHRSWASSDASASAIRAA